MKEWTKACSLPQRNHSNGKYKPTQKGWQYLWWSLHFVENIDLWSFSKQNCIHHSVHKLRRCHWFLSKQLWHFDSLDPMLSYHLAWRSCVCWKIYENLEKKFWVKNLIQNWIHVDLPFPSSRTTIQQFGSNLSINSNFLTYSNLLRAILRSK